MSETKSTVFPSSVVDSLKKSGLLFNPLMQGLSIKDFKQGGKFEGLHVVATALRDREGVTVNGQVNGKNIAILDFIFTGSLVITAENWKIIKEKVITEQTFKLANGDEVKYNNMIFQDVLIDSGLNEKFKTIHEALGMGSEESKDASLSDFGQLEIVGVLCRKPNDVLQELMKEAAEYPAPRTSALPQYRSLRNASTEDPSDRFTIEDYKASYIRKNEEKPNIESVVRNENNFAFTPIFVVEDGKLLK